MCVNACKIEKTLYLYRNDFQSYGEKLYNNKWTGFNVPFILLKPKTLYSPPTPSEKKCLFMEEINLVNRLTARIKGLMNLSHFIEAFS